MSIITIAVLAFAVCIIAVYIIQGRRRARRRAAIIGGTAFLCVAGFLLCAYCYGFSCGMPPLPDAPKPLPARAADDSIVADTPALVRSFIQFRAALYNQDVAAARAFVDFPIYNAGIEIWAVCRQPVPPADVIVPFGPHHFKACFHELFPPMLVKALLRVHSLTLFSAGAYETPLITGDDGLSYRLICTYDKEQRTLVLNLAATSPAKKEGEDGVEWNYMYEFSAADDGRLRFVQVRVAG